MKTWYVNFLYRGKTTTEKVEAATLIAAVVMASNNFARDNILPSKTVDRWVTEAGEWKAE